MLLANGACTAWIAFQATSKPLIHGVHRPGQGNLEKSGVNSFWKSRGKIESTWKFEISIKIINFRLCGHTHFIKIVMFLKALSQPAWSHSRGRHQIKICIMLPPLKIQSLPWPKILATWL